MKIRTVKPEFWQSEKLATKTSRDARLLLIGLLCMADDHGRFRAHPNLIRGEVFPYEADADVESWLGELVALGIVQLYQVGGQSYGLVSNFHEHQKIDKRWASRLPPPPALEPPEPPPKRGDSPHGLNGRSDQPSEQSASLPTSSASLSNSTPTDRIGSEGKGTEPLQTRASAREGPGKPRPEKQSAEPKQEQPYAVIEIQRQLLFAGYRSNLKPHDRVRQVLAKAIELNAIGMTPDELVELVALDREKAKTQGSLLATWVDRRQWRDVLAEQAMKAKERGAKVRGAAASAAAENGLVAEPDPASSIIDNVLRSATGGGA